MQNLFETAVQFMKTSITQRSVNLILDWNFALMKLKRFKIKTNTARTYFYPLKSTITFLIALWFDIVST